jgi:hypothetical protein
MKHPIVEYWENAKDGDSFTIVETGKGEILSALRELDARGYIQLKDRRAWPFRLWRFIRRSLRWPR